MSRTTIVWAAAVLLAGCSQRTTVATPPSELRSPRAPTVAQEAPLTYHAPARTVAAGTGSLLSSRSAAVRAAAVLYPEASTPGSAEPPVSLTASDGTGLGLVGLKAKAVLDGPLAFTELHLTFENPTDRQIEGRFNITLPQGAAISRFAMMIQGHWQEAEVVERQAARETYESFLHRRQDPALLEKQAANAFRARIFPIPPKSLKEIVVSYSEELAGTKRYRLHLKGLPRVDRLEVTALVGRTANRQGASLGGTLTSRQVIQVKKERWVPDQDFEVAPDGGAAGLRHANLAVVRVKPRLPTRPDPIGSLLVLVDTSASRAAGFAGQVERLGALVKAIAARHGEALPLKVVCFDQSVEPVYDGPADKFAEKAELERILARRALGASNLHGALQWARQVKGYRRLLLVTDAVATAGHTEGAELRRAASGLKGEVERLDVLLVGGIRDEALARRLVAGVLRRDGAVLDGDLGSERLARQLGRATLSGIEVVVPGARWVWPSVLDGMQAGDEVLVYADLPEKAWPQDRPLEVQLSGPVTHTVKARLEPAERPLLERAFVQAEIQRLEHRRDTLSTGSAEEAKRVRKRIVDLSTRHRVLSDHTALLVLETEWDYQRFGIDRKSLADILVVGPTGVEVHKRSRPAPVPAAGQAGRVQGKGESGLGTAFGRDTALGTDSEDALGGLIGNQIGEANGAGGLGLQGTGRGGGGTGEGTIGIGRLGTIGRGGGGGAGAGYGRGAGRLAAPQWLRKRGLYGLRGPRDNPDPHLARRLSEDASRNSGVLGLLRSGEEGKLGSRSRRARAPRVVAGRAEVRGSLDKEIIRRIIRRHINEVRYCYQVELQANPSLAGRVVVRFVIQPSGQVSTAQVQSSSLGNARVEACIARAVRRWLFPKPAGGGTVVVSYPFVFRAAGGGGGPAPDPSPSVSRGGAVVEVPAPRQASAPPSGPPATSGRLRQVTDLLRRGRTDQALVEALRWRSAEPGDVLALVALGQALAASGRAELAARAFGSIIDLYPSRADMRRFAGQQLEALGQVGLALAADTFAVAVRQRPDHPTGYRLLAYAHLRQGRPEQAAETLEKGLARRYPDDRFRGYQRVLREDLGLVAAAWTRQCHRPGCATRIAQRAQRSGATVAHEPSLRFVLQWETDANDVDLHVHDGRGNHAFYSSPHLGSGGSLYDDVTTGYGPECFAIAGKATAFPYRLRAHYYARGPMGYGMGTLQVIQHDGQGVLRLTHRPFVVMNDRAFVELGKIKGPL